MIMPGAGVLLEQLEAADLGDIQVIGADSFDATVVWSAGDVANGVSFTAHTFPTRRQRRAGVPRRAEAAGVEIETVSFGALASDVVKVFAHAATEACSTDGAALIETISAISDLEVTTGTGHLRRHERGAARRTSSSSPSPTASRRSPRRFQPSFVP